LVLFLTLSLASSLPAEQLRKLFFLFGIICLLFILLSLGQSIDLINLPLAGEFQTGSRFYEARFILPPGVHSNPNQLGLLGLTGSISTALGCAFTSRKRLLPRIIFLLANTIFVFTEVEYEARAALLGSTLMICIVALDYIIANQLFASKLLKMTARAIALAMSIIIALIALILLVYRDNFSSLLSGRNEIWNAYISSFASSPLLGHGAHPLMTLSAHNSFLMTIYSHGILGAIVNFLFVLYVYLLFASRLNTLGLVPLFSLVTILFYSCFDVNGFGFLGILTMPVVISSGACLSARKRAL